MSAAFYYNALKTITLLNASAFGFMLVANGLSNALPLNGKTTGEISAGVPVLFTPAAATFAIWGMIYLLLLGFVVYQLLPKQHTALFLERIRYWFLFSCILNALWLVCWHYEYFLLTFLVMLGLLASLIRIYSRLDIGRRPVKRPEFWLVHLPFSVYLGWISAATLANAAILLTVLNIKSLGLPPVVFTWLLMLAAGIVGVLVLLKRNDPAYPVVTAWALLGIAVRHQTTSPIIAVPAVIFVCVLLITILLVTLNRRPEFLNGISTKTS